MKARGGPRARAPGGLGLPSMASRTISVTKIRQAGRSYLPNNLNSTHPRLPNVRQRWRDASSRREHRCARGDRSCSSSGVRTHRSESGGPSQAEQHRREGTEAVRMGEDPPMVARGVLGQRFLRRLEAIPGRLFRCHGGRCRDPMGLAGHLQRSAEVLAGGTWRASRIRDRSLTRARFLSIRRPPRLRAVPGGV
jgi:hypothetical protein